MKVVVFTSCYNQGEFLGQAVESVLAQTVSDFEYILISDGSTDLTSEIINDYANRDSRIIPVMMEKQPNVSYCMNHCVSLTGPDSAIVWMPADDVVAPDLLEKKLLLLTDNTVVLSWGWRMNAYGSLIDTIEFDWTDTEDFRKRMWKQCFIGMTGVMIPKTAFDKVGGFPTHFPCSEDYYWVLKSLAHGVQYRYVNDHLYFKRHHANRTTERHAIDIPSVVKQIHEELAWARPQ